MKRLISLIVATVLITIAMSSMIICHAEGETPGSTTPVGGSSEPGSTVITGSSEVNVDVQGDVEPVATMSVVIPTRATFIIDENRNFISPDYTIINNSNVSIKVTAVSLVADAATAAKVVSKDTYTDAQWAALDEANTKSKIALGFTQGSAASNLAAPFTDVWFAGEGAQSPIVLGTINATNNSQLCMKLLCKYGKAWKNATNLDLNYKLTLLLEAEGI